MASQSPPFHGTLKGLRKDSKIINVPQHKYAKDSHNVAEVKGVFTRLSTLLLYGEDAIDKLLLQGRCLSRKINQWVMEARVLKCQLSDLIREQENSKGHWLKYNELMELSINIINKLNQCPFTDDMRYEKPIFVMVLTNKSDLSIPSGRREKNSTRVSKHLKKHVNDVLDKDVEMSSLEKSSSILELVGSTDEITEEDMSHEDTEPDIAREMTNPMEISETVSSYSHPAEGSKYLEKSITSPIRTDDLDYYAKTKTVTINVTGEMSKFVDLKVEISRFSPKEILNSNHGFSYIDLVSEKEDYSFLAKKKQELDQESGSLLPENLILNKRDLKPSEYEWHQYSVINFSDQDFSLPDKPEKDSSLSDKLDCPNLLLLFLQRNNFLTRLPSTFFDGLPGLCFLDLSGTRIKILPTSLFSLAKLQALLLKNCVCLDTIPNEIEKLEFMEVLDLSGTELYNLPDGIGRLSRLSHFQVSFYGPDDESEYAHLPSKLVAKNIISNLQALQELTIVVHPEDRRWAKVASDIMLEVGKLNMLSCLQFYFPKVEMFKQFIEVSPSWKKGILAKFKFVIGNNVTRVISRIPDGVESRYNQQEQCLRYVNGEQIPEVIKIVLKQVTAFYLDHHTETKSLSEFDISNFNKLKIFVVRECPNVQIIGKEGSEIAFPCLEHFEVHYMWTLKKIWSGPLHPESFNALKSLRVNTCPKLEFIFTRSILQCVINLEELVVEDCESMKAIIKEVKGRVKYDFIVLPQLKKIELRLLPQLVSLGGGLCLSNEQVSTYDCPKFILNQRKLLCSLCGCTTRV